MSQQEQLAYSTILRSLSAFADTIDISSVDKRVDVNKIFKALIDDNPQFFYFDKSKITTLASSSKRHLKLSSCIKKPEAMKMLNELNTITNPLIETAMKRSRDSYERLLYVYEHLQKHIAYDEAELKAAAKGKSLHQNAHNMYGALVERKAVCDGFAAAFQYMAQNMGYRCVTVSGTSDHSAYGNIAHSWNIIELGGKYYHLDLTWDANHYAENHAYSYDWFLLDDENALADHNWDVSSTPIATDASLMWHELSGLVANNESEIVEIFTKAVRKPVSPIYIRCTKNIWSARPIGEYLAQLLIDTALRCRSKVEIEYSWNEKTNCFFGRFAKLG
jgi:hypothetical protein